ncbi:hypothetical protein [Vibrio quintilis]|uniref:Uncharacterized protein n=1 Tax=Vibrio quintilis TaxID=1117707 RepID=A0A1M7Z323_9VIBR|nr:hypothetical protein [Vibrio quintilis]SHO59190.1 hypothetical protein VQ7734_04970 [Vibrio quintilis]
MRTNKMLGKLASAIKKIRQELYMSKELALLQFIENNDGLICEDYSNEIESSGISVELLDELIENFGLDTQEISEEYGSAEKSTYSFIPNDKIDDIIEFLEDRYIREIESTAHQLGLTDNSQGNAQIIVNGQSRETRLSLRLFLNVFSLIELKNTQFKQDNFTFIKVRG